MTKQTPEQMLADIAETIRTEQDVTTGKWFGKPCLKVDGKVFAVYWQGDMAFKLDGEAHARAMQEQGARLFDPRQKGRPMKEWVQIPAGQWSIWRRFAGLSCKYVAGAAQAQKETLIDGLVKVRKKILAEATRLPPEAQDEVFLGVWSVKDLLAHLVGWDYTNLQAVEEILAGQRPGFFAFHDRDWQSYNARLVAKYGRDDPAALFVDLEASHRKLIDYLQTIPADTYVNHKRISTLLRAETRDEEAHFRQIETFRKHHAA